MNLYSTNDLKQYIDSMYSKIARIAKQDNVYLDMCTRFEFADVGYPEGEYCFSDGQAYRYRCLERGEIIEDRETKSIFDITYWATETSILDNSQ